MSPGGDGLDGSHFANKNGFWTASGKIETGMRIISKARLRTFWEMPGHEDAEGPLRAWYTHISQRIVAWQTWRDVKADFASASLVGNCVVFNIGGNKYRLVTRILYRSQKAFTLKVMTHKEYDEDKWKEECGCFAGPPPRDVSEQPTKRKKRK